MTRSRVLAAARTAFAELGYAATTYRLLADRTGLAPSALYNYYTCKADLYAAVHDEVQFETYAKWILPAIEGTTTLAARLDALLGCLVAMNVEAPEVARFRAAARIDAARHPELAPVRDGLPTQRRHLFADMVDLGVSTGEVMEPTRATVLAMLETLTLGLVEVSSSQDMHARAIAGFRAMIAPAISGTSEGVS